MADPWPSQIWWIGRLSFYAICLDLLEMNWDRVTFSSKLLKRLGDVAGIAIR